MTIQLEQLLAQAEFSLLPWGLFSLAVLWLGSVGACIGSFINVIVYRLPLGMSVVRPPSQCPLCHHLIRWHDNLPIFGWLALRGRCRDCRAEISPRYPLIELMAAALGLLLARRFLLVASRSDPVTNTLDWSSHTMLMVGTYAIHLLTVYTLLAAALIRTDGQRTSRWFFAPAILAGLVASMGFSQIPWSPPSIALRPNFLDGSTGLAAGILLGWLSVPGKRNGLAAAGATTRDTQLGLCGLLVGWQAVVVVAVVAAAAPALIRRAPWRPSRGRWLPWSLYLAVATAAYLIALPEILDLFPEISDKGAVMWLTAGGLLVRLLTQTTPQATPINTTLGMIPVLDPQTNLEAIVRSESYRLAERDTEFLARPELRPVRMQLELLKPEMAFEANGIQSTIVAFGGTQIVDHAEATARLETARGQLRDDPGNSLHQRAVERAERILAKAHFYEHAREFSQLVSAAAQSDQRCDYVIITGGGPGVMEAANRGASEAGAKSIGLNITLPDEQAPNPYITPGLCFQFHYFALRKMHFLLRARALVVFPGGFGTLDELFDALTLRQVGRMQTIPVILFGREYWERVIDFQFLADEGVIRDEHLDLFEYVESPQEAWDKIRSFHLQSDAEQSGEP